MPTLGAGGGTVIQIASQAELDTLLGTAVTAERAARVTRDEEWDALPQGGSCATMQTAFAAYQTAVQSAMQSARAGASIGKPYAREQCDRAFRRTAELADAALADMRTTITAGGKTVSAARAADAATMDARIGGTGGAPGALMEARQNIGMTDYLLADLPAEGDYAPLDYQRVIVSEIFMPSGAKYGYANFEIRSWSGASEDANEVALESAYEALRIGRRVNVYRVAGGGATKALIWSGLIAQVSQDVERDAIIAVAYDDRWAWDDVRVIGRWVLDGYTGQPSFQPGWPAIFNPGGRPNCIDTLAGHVDDDGQRVPIFAPHPDWGITSDATADTTLSTSKACYWTLDKILKYLRYYYGPQGAAVTTALNTAIKTIPATAAWNQMSGVAGRYAANFNEGRQQSATQASAADRKGREVNADQRVLLELVEELLATAGGYTIGYTVGKVETVSGGTTTVGARPRIFLAQKKWDGSAGGVKFRLARGGQAATALAAAPTWHGGITAEDGTALVTQAVTWGALDKIERRVQSGVALDQGWTAAREAALKADGRALSVGTAEGMRKLFSKYPEVYSTWRLAPSYDIYPPTAPRTQAKIARPVLGYLLSLLSGTGDFAAMRYPIPVEIREPYSSDESAWSVATEFTGLEVWDTGQIYMPALRDLTLSGQTGSWRWPATAWDFTTGPQAMDLRMTVAIPSDYRMQQVATMSNVTDAAASAVLRQIHSARVSPSWAKIAHVDARGLYHSHYRYQSYPVPARAGGTTQTGYVRDDRALALEHAARRLAQDGALQRSGHIVCAGIYAGALIGQPVDSWICASAGAAARVIPARCVVSGYRWRSISGRVETELLLT